MPALYLCASLAGIAFASVGCAAAEDYAAPESFTVSNQAVAEVVKSAVDGSSGATEMTGSPEVSCSKRTYCAIDYTIEESTGISTDRELIQPTRQAWKALFTDPKFESGIITVKGPTTSVGGKSGTSRLFTLNCDREAASAIDWDNVDGEGIRTLCDYSPRVKGL